MNLPEGHLLQKGKYRLTHVVGQGGFGITYKGVWLTEVKGPLGTVKTEVPVCVKEYFFKDYCYRDQESLAVKVYSETGKNLFNKFKEKLIKEAKILSEVHHPYIVNVLEVFEENNTAYIAMEFIAGHSLKYMLEKNGVLSEGKLLKYTREIGEALSFVHDKSILHLDIKPSNILIDNDDKARLIDFGVSKRYDMEQEETSTTMLTLSKGFASIEQYDDEGTQQFSPCPDIYSLGATMYNLLTGKIPTESILRATRPLIAPKDINNSISHTTNEVIMKAMRIIPSERYQTVGDMMDALDFSNIDLTPQFMHGSFKEDMAADDETLLYGADNNGVDLLVDDDETIISAPDNTKETLIPAKKNHKERVFLIGFTIFAIAGTLMFLYHLNRISESTEIVVDNGMATEASPETHSPFTVDNGRVVVDSTTTLVKESDPEKVKGESEEPMEAKESIAAKSEAITNNAVEQKSEAPSEEDIERKYDSLVVSGKELMAQGNFFAARADFSMAKETKLTEEVVRLIIECDELEEKRRIADNFAKYEQKMPFGKFKIVRKKSSNRYGAIDEMAEERIPCKYISVGIADNGRAFEREDNLFDIYNSEGTLISEGRAYY